MPDLSNCNVYISDIRKTNHKQIKFGIKSRYICSDNNKVLVKIIHYSIEVVYGGAIYFDLKWLEVSYFTNLKYYFLNIKIIKSSLKISN